MSAPNNTGNAIVIVGIPFIIIYAMINDVNIQGIGLIILIIPWLLAILTWTAINNDAVKLNNRLGKEKTELEIQKLRQEIFGKEEQK
jgi:hypothetical protein